MTASRSCAGRRRRHRRPFSRYIHDRALHHPQKGLLDALAADVAAVHGLALGDLVELVEHDDALLGGLDVVVGLDQEPLDARLDVLADVAGLREGVAVAYRKGNVDRLAQGSGRRLKSALFAPRPS